MPKASEPRPQWAGRALLDVNVLIALLDAAHVHHATATRWLKQEMGAGGWASCPITQIGCVRIMSQPAYSGALKAAEVAERLEQASQHASHEFWPADLSLTEQSGLSWQHLLGHRQVTDTYLLALAVHHGGRLVTFDQRISIRAVKGASASNLAVIGG
jgi:uncharacterized protein